MLNRRGAWITKHLSEMYEAPSFGKPHAETGVSSCAKDWQVVQAFKYLKATLDRVSG